MNFHQQETPLENGQSPGCDPKTSKRNSGLFSFFKWFKPSVSRESIDTDGQNSLSSSCESITSIQSNGTIASFSFVPPNAYNNGCVTEKNIAVGPETDTYKARLKQRDKRRENDRNLTLRKKYNLFFNRDTLLKTVPKQSEEENTKSLPLMTRTATMEVPEEKIHRRTNSESSKVKKAGAYLHVKGKRRAPQPPGYKDNCSTSSLRRKKRLAPPPPAVNVEKTTNKQEDFTKYEIIEYADGDIIFNDSLKLDHGILKSVKGVDSAMAKSDQDLSADANSSNTSARSSYLEQPVSPRPWYKRNSNRNSVVNKKDKEQKTDHKYEHVERLPEVSFMRNSTIDLTAAEDIKIDKKKDEKRKSQLTFLTNISELDREASEIIKKEHIKNGDDVHQEIPEFMRPRPDTSKINIDSWVSPKKRSAKDLIAKFNAITNVTKVTVNSAFFGGTQKDKRDYFGKNISLSDDKKQEVLLENHRKRIEKIDNKLNEVKAANPLSKSESASAIKNVKPETPKSERKTWNCPKCGLSNEYWRIICYVCSAIKPYFDDFSHQPNKSNENKEVKNVTKVNNSPPLGNNPDRILERSKTQIGFSALANYNSNQNKNKFQKSVSTDEKTSKAVDGKKEEREKLKKMLIEMKNSLPKRKSNVLKKQNSRSSVILENPENSESEILDKKAAENNADNINEKTDKAKESINAGTKQNEQEPKEVPEWKVAEIIIGTSETIYENIKVKKTESSKPSKVSASAQTSSVVKKITSDENMPEFLKDDQKMKNNFELMRPKDFEDIYTDTNAKSAARVYANLARNDELSLFFNVPKNMHEIKKNSDQAASVNPNTDTIEINRLLRRLETAISKGELTEAAIFAKELAQLKVNCSVIRQKASKDVQQKEKGFSIEMYVEDKISHRGPFPIQVTQTQTLEELKRQVEKEFDIPVNVQRWILGKELATKDKATLKDYNITSAGSPVFLYLVAPEIKQGTSESKPILPVNMKIPTKPAEKSPSPLLQTKAQIKTEVTASTSNNVGNIFQAPKPEQPAESQSIVQKPEISISASNPPKVISVIPKVVESISNEQLKLAPRYKSQKPQVTLPTKVELVKQTSVEVKPIIVDVSNKVLSLSKKDDSADKHSMLNKLPVQNKLREDKPKPESVAGPSERRIPIHVEGRDEEVNKETEKATKADANNRLGAISKTEINAKRDSCPKLATPEDDDYDTKTLKPHVEEWECHLCTLLNPVSSNICAVCATIRLKTNIKGKKPLKKKAPQPNDTKEINKDQTYQQLVNLDNADLVENTEPFECVICFLDVTPRQGVTLRECLHQFCKMCLAQTVEYTEEAEVKCPYRDDQYSCNIALQDREIKSLVSPAQYEKFLAKSVAQAENKIGKSFHCKSPDCNGWCIFEDNVNEFRCPVCQKVNCLTCQAIHMDMNCRQYQEKMHKESEVDENARRTKEMLEEMVAKGEAIACPTCQVILMKKWGCDWLRCSMCKTEICWVTRGPRWGPLGKGDTSGGCQCGVNGVKCHPQCNYCH